MPSAVEKISESAGLTTRALALDTAASELPPISITFCAFENGVPVTASGTPSPFVSTGLKVDGSVRCMSELKNVPCEPKS